MCEKGRWNENGGSCRELYDQLEVRKDKVAPFGVIEFPECSDRTPAICKVQVIFVGDGYHLRAKIEGDTRKHGALKWGPQAVICFIQSTHLCFVKLVQFSTELLECVCGLDSNQPPLHTEGSNVLLLAYPDIRLMFGFNNSRCMTGSWRSCTRSMWGFWRFFEAHYRYLRLFRVHTELPFPEVMPTLMVGKGPLRLSRCP